MNEKNKKNRENTAPFIGLVPIPSLTIDCVDVNYQMEVTDTGIRAECNGEEQFIEADHVVLAVGYRNRSNLYEELQDLGGGGLPDRRFPADKEDCGCGKRRLPHRTEYLRKYGVC